MSVEVDIKALLEAGVHFGHKTSRWHPKMAPYIHSKRQDSHIVDLTKTVEGLEKALPFVTEVVSKGKQVLFVGTKKQAKDIVREAAEAAGQPYVTERWMGGMLTNVATITGQIKNLKALEPELQAEVEFGWQNSKGADPDEVIENVQMFLAHDADWREKGEPLVADFRRDAWNFGGWSTCIPFRGVTGFRGWGNDPFGACG